MVPFVFATLFLSGVPALSWAQSGSPGTPGTVSTNDVICAQTNYLNEPENPPPAILTVNGSSICGCANNIDAAGVSGYRLCDQISPPYGQSGYNGDGYQNLCSVIDGLATCGTDCTPEAPPNSSGGCGSQDAVQSASVTAADAADASTSASASSAPSSASAEPTAASTNNFEATASAVSDASSSTLSVEASSAPSISTSASTSTSPAAFSSSSASLMSTSSHASTSPSVMSGARRDHSRRPAVLVLAFLVAHHLT